jgi:hypothetical protein
MWQRRPGLVSFLPSQQEYLSATKDSDNLRSALLCSCSISGSGSCRFGFEAFDIADKYSTFAMFCRRCYRNIWKRCLSGNEDLNDIPNKDDWKLTSGRKAVVTED